MEDFGGKMKKRLQNRNFWYTAVFLFIFSFIVFFGKNFVRAADVPNIITYQGKLLVNGSAATTTQSMKFVLYDSSSGGTALYTASGTLPTTSSISVTVSSGFFTVNFGDTGTNSLDPDIFKNNSAVYLEVTIGSEILTPRKRLTAASYAFNSKYLNGVSATATPQGSAYIPVSDSVGNFNFSGVTSTVLTVSGETNLATTTLSTLNSIDVNGTNLNFIDGSILFLTSSGTASLTSLSAVGNSTLATTTISSSTIGYLNVSNNTNIDGLLSVTGNSSFGTITAGTWNGNAISAIYGGTGQNTSGWTGFVKVVGGTWTTSSISVGDISNSSTLALLAANQTFTGTNTFNATSTFSSSSFSGYVGVGTTTPQQGLHLYDRSLLVDNPVNPTVIGSIVSSTALGSPISLEILGNYAFVAAMDDGITVVDISNKSNPSIVSTFNNSGTMNTGPMSMAVSGNYAYTIGGLNYFSVVDVSDPKSLVMAGSVQDDDFLSQGKIVISGKYAYVVSSNADSLIILDVSKASSPTIVGRVTSSVYLDGAYGLSVVGKYAYVVSTNSNSLAVVDISNPHAPSIVGSVTGADLNYARNVYVSGRYAYVAAQNANALTVVDIFDPTTPVVVGTVSDSTNLKGPFGIEVAGKYAYVTCLGNPYRLAVVDISNVTSPRLVASLSDVLINNPLNLKVAGKYAYVTGLFSNAMVIVDIKGAEISSADIGNITTNDLTVWEDVNIGKNLTIKNGLNIGNGGLLSSGALAVSVSSTVSTNTIFSAGTNTTSSILAVNADGSVTIKNLIVSGPTSLATTTISSSTIGYLNISNNANIDGLLNVTGNSSFGTITAGTWNGTAISATYGGTGQDSSGWTGFVKVTAGTWATSSISVSDISNSSTLALLANSQTFTSTNTFSAATIFASTTFNGYVGIGTSTPASRLHLYGGTLTVDGPTNMSVVGSITNPTILSSGTGIDISGKYAYVVDDSYHGMAIIDVTRPSSPSIISSIANTTFLNTPRAIQVAGRYAYVVDYDAPGLVVLDISNVTSPTITGYVTSSAMTQISSLHISGKYAYVTTASSLFIIIDISNPSAPTIMNPNDSSNPTYYLSAKGIYVSGKYAYVTSYGSDRITIVDISNPKSPTIVGSTTSSNLNGASAVLVAGRYAYVTSELDNSLVIVDISSSTAPTTTGFLKDNTNLSVPTDVKIAGKYAYVTARTGDKLAVVDISNKSSPFLLSTLAIVGPNKLSISGKYAYVVQYLAGKFSVVDLSGADIQTANIGSVFSDILTVFEDADFGNNIRVRNSLTVGNGGIFSNGPFGLYAEDYVTSTIFSVAASTTPNILSIKGDGKIGIGTSTPQEKLHLYDGTLLVDSPVNPTLTGSYTTTSLAAKSVYVSGKYAYVLSANGLAIVDIGRKNTPSAVGFALIGGVGTAGDRSVAVSGKYAYVTSYTSSTLNIIDVSNPAAPVLTGSVASSTALSGAKSVVVSGRYAYVIAYNDNRLTVVDVSSPSNPTIVGSKKDNTQLLTPAGLYVSGKYAYVASKDSNSLTILDISVPVSPTIVGFKDDAIYMNGAYSVYVSGKYAYVVSNFSNSFAVVDVSDPTNPTVVGTLINSTILNDARSVFVSGKYAYVVGQFSDYFSVVDVSNPTAPRIIGSYTSASVNAPNSIFVSGKYAYVASINSDNLAILDIKGADISTADIGSIAVNSLTVSENLEVGNIFNVRNSLNVGRGGIFLNGDLSMSETYYNNLQFSTTTEFATAVPSDSLNAFIFDAKNTPTSSSQYLLSIRAAGTPVFSVSSNGNVHALGTLSASSATVGTPGTPGDLAERVDISLDDSVEPGDVVVVDPNSIDTYRRSSGEYSETVAGVISTNPTIVVGNGKTENTALMAMVGRVPIKVSTENGAIRKGDLLVTASMPGFAMRYDITKDESAKTISVVGLALEDLEINGTGKIMGLVKTGWINNSAAALSVMKSDLQKMATAQGVALGSSQSLNVQNVNGNLTYSGGDLNLQGYELLNVASISGKNNKWFIDKEGRFVTRLSTSQGDKDMYAMQSPNSEFVFSSSSQMVSGEAKIVFDQYVQEVIDQQQPIKINITLTSGEGKGIYVSEKSAQGFTVKELDSGSSNSTFDWIVVATRKSDNQEIVNEIINNIQSENSGAELNSNMENIQTSSSTSSVAESSTSTVPANSESATESENSSTAVPAASSETESGSVSAVSEPTQAPVVSVPETVSTPEPAPASNQANTAAVQ